MCICLTANDSFPLVLTDLDWFVDNGEGKKIYFTEVSGAETLVGQLKIDA